MDSTQTELAKAALNGNLPPINDNSNLGPQLDRYSIEDVVEYKIARFLDQLGTYYPEDLHELIMAKTEKPLMTQILKRVGGNQVHAARILGINRNTLRKKMKIYGISI
jgi:Fis family transcriptional regulator, factor for inversion stimulation protein